MHKKLLIISLVFLLAVVVLGENDSGTRNTKNEMDIYANNFCSVNINRTYRFLPHFDKW